MSQKMREALHGFVNQRLEQIVPRMPPITDMENVAEIHEILRTVYVAGLRDGAKPLGSMILDK